MLPGKKYTAEDVVRVVARRAWILVLTLGLCAAATVVVSKRLPNRYRSETLIMLIPQRIPDNYVKAAVTAKIEDRLNSLDDQILSRSRLETIILDLNLYPSQRRSLPMEDVVQRMRDEINVKVEGRESFRITYVSQEAKTAQRATERLASLFIEENLRDRENIAEDTNQFLNTQLEDAKRRLLEHEKKLEEYRTRFGGELPTQAATNLQGMQNAQVQLQSLAETADRARERRLLLERQVADLETAPAPQSATAAAPQDVLAGESTAQQLQLAQGRLDLLLTRFKPDHPDVKAMQRTIRDLRAKLEVEDSRRPATTATAPSTDVPRDVPSAAERLRRQRIKDLKQQIDDIDRQLTDKQEQDRKLRAAVADYQSKLDAVPKRESELVELTRDYTTLQASYQSLLVKREDAKLAASLERRNIGEQFKVLDPARAPERPFSPNRILINLGGIGAGFALGLLLIGVLEYSDSSLKNEDDVVRVLNVRVLALVPAMNSNVERRAKRWWIAAIGGGVAVLVASSVALAIWRLRP